MRLRYVFLSSESLKKLNLKPTDKSAPTTLSEKLLFGTASLATEELPAFNATNHWFVKSNEKTDKEIIVKNLRFITNIFYF